MSSLAILLLISASFSNAQQPSSNDPSSVPTDPPSPPGGGASVPSSTGYEYGAVSGPAFENYYFVLIGILVVLLAVAYLFCRRSRRRALTRRRARGELPTDIEGRSWAGRPWRSPAVRDPRREEGLDERGEAPPAYLPAEPGPAPYSERDEHGEGIALQQLAGKPPDYDANDSEDDLSLTRPTPTHPPHGRHAWARHLLGRTDDREPSTALGSEMGNTNAGRVEGANMVQQEGASEHQAGISISGGVRNSSQERDGATR
ncbi:hypothetical protein MMC13_000139 [Lambiella insularis]|nr:hypothetical protein [Lambiella insularis]